MVDFARVQNRIYYGYTKAAVRLGTTHAIYRPPNAINPLQAGNFLKNAFISVDSNLKYMTPKKYGDLTWQFLPENGLTLQNYDYMVGDTTTYFIADIAPTDRLSPPLCVECNGVITIKVPSNLPLTPGKNPYQSYNEPTSEIIAQNLPCAILQHTRVDASNMKLPTSVKLPYYTYTIPIYENLIIKTDYVILDNHGRRLSVINAEQTRRSMGFRIIAVEQGT